MQVREGKEEINSKGSKRKTEERGLIDYILFTFKRGEEVKTDGRIWERREEEQMKGE